MADYSFGYGGIGSNINISTMVNQLVAADRAPQDARLNKLESTAKFKRTGVGNVASAFSTLQTALNNLKKADAFGSRTVSSVSSDANGAPVSDSIVSSTVGKSTPLGAYKVEVEQLATAHKLLGTGVSTTTTFGAGSLNLTVGEKTVAVDIKDGSTLAEVRGLISDAAKGMGIQVAVLTSDAGQHLSLTADQTGSKHAISLTLGSGGSDLQGLVDGIEERVPAQDAKLKIDGLSVTSQTNSVSTAVPGLTLTLKKEGTSTVTVANDAAAGRAVVQSFVTAYNAAVNAIANSTKYDAESDTPSSLTGDAQMRGAATQLRGTLNDMLGELAKQGLDAKTLGLQTKGYPAPDGTLVFDSAKFDALLASQPNRIVDAFTGDNGFAAKVGKVVDSYVGDKGAFTLRTKGLDAQLKDVTKQRESLETRMLAVAERYKAQFVALDSMVGSLNNTSNYLSQQLSMLAAQSGG